MTSCPAIAFKNYTNVFAEITKNVIGEINDSTSEYQDDDNEYDENNRVNLSQSKSREALAEISILSKGNNK